MSLLIASYCYPPLRYPRSVQVARLVAQLPPETTVVCGAEPGAGDASLLATYPDDGRRVVRVPWSAASTAARRIRGRVLGDRVLVPDAYRLWQRDAARAIRHHGLLEPGALLVTFGQPMSDHLLGLRLARPRGNRWIAHFSDPWVDSSFRTASALTRRANAWLEARVIASADAIVFTSEETVELVMAKYEPSLRRKAHVIPHGFDPVLYPSSAPRDAGVVVRYLGNFYGDRGPEPLLLALRRLLAERPDVVAGIRFELIGSSEHPLPAAALADLPEGLVWVRPPVDYLESLSLMRSSDLLLVLDAPADRSVFLPSKLIDYLGARRPILALTPPGAAASLVLRVGGWQGDPANTTSAAAALADALDTARTCASAPWGRADVIDAYAAERVGASFLELIREVEQTPR